MVKEIIKEVPGPEVIKYVEKIIEKPVASTHGCVEREVVKEVPVRQDVPVVTHRPTVTETIREEIIKTVETVKVGAALLEG